MRIISSVNLHEMYNVNPSHGDETLIIKEPFIHNFPLPPNIISPYGNALKLILQR